MSKKTTYYLIGAAIILVGVLLVLSKKGIIGNKDTGIEIEIAKADTMTIV